MKQIIIFFVALVLTLAPIMPVVADSEIELVILPALPNSRAELVVEIAQFVSTSRIDPARPMIALTFDDGPDVNYTTRILDVLEKYGQRATFFVLGDRIYNNPEHAEIIRRMGNGGFEVVGHSWNHSRLTTLLREEVAWQITETHSVIEEIVGSIPPFFRPPFGGEDSMVRSVAAVLGFSIVNWSVDSWDWYHRDADIITDLVLRQVSDGDIVLFHDRLDAAAVATERIVSDLVARGYQLVTVSELFWYRGIDMEPGTVYLDGHVPANPAIRDGSFCGEYHALVPLRKVAEWLGYTVGWNDETQEIIVGDVALRLGEYYFTARGNVYRMPLAAIVENGVTLVTACSLHNFFGVNVDYDTTGKRIVIRR